MGKKEKFRLRKCRNLEFKQKKNAEREEQGKRYLSNLMH